jgi:hypothetical protein
MDFKRKTRLFSNRALVILAAISVTLAACGSSEDLIGDQIPSAPPLDYSPIRGTDVSDTSHPFSAFAGAYNVLAQAPQFGAVLGNSQGAKITDRKGRFGDLGFSFGNPQELLEGLAPASGFFWRTSNSYLALAVPTEEEVTESYSDGFTESRTNRFELMYQGIPLIGYSAVGHFESQRPNSPDEQPDWFSGRLPQFLLGDSDKFGTSAPYSFSEFTYDAETMRRRYAAAQGYSPEVVGSGRRVYYTISDRVRAAYEFVISASSNAKTVAPTVPLKAYVDADTGELLEQIPLALHVDGIGRGYRENAVASSAEGIIDLPLPLLSDTSGRLENSLMQVKTCRLQVAGTGCSFGATGGSGGDFGSYAPESPEYDEVVAYYATARAMNWYRGLMGATPGAFATENSWTTNRLNFGLERPEIGRLTIYVRAMTRTPTSGTTLDNAVYLPGGTTGQGSPEVVIGTGWEATFTSPPRALRYIGKDADVSMHEFGHHIVYRTITDIKGQALGMHEGFADYFTYATTGNNLLAESVVSTGSYLRAGNRTGTLADYPPSSSTPPHTAGEFWSTVLWDIRTSMGSWRDGFHKFDKIVYHAIDLMLPNETYYGAIAAMSRSAEIFAAATGDDPVALKETIFRAFHKRGFVAAPSGNGSMPQPSSLLLQATKSAAVPETAAQSPSTSSRKASKKTSIFGMSCAVGSQHKSSSPIIDLGTLTLLLFAGLLPFASLRRRLDLRPLRVIIKVVNPGSRGQDE